MKFKTTAGKLPIISEGIYRIYPNIIKENRRMPTCNQLDLQTLGSQPVMRKNLPDHRYEARHGKELNEDFISSSIKKEYAISMNMIKALVRDTWCPCKLIHCKGKT